MPIEHGKSAKVFEHNVKTEVKEGKPVKQAVAIAYSEKREAEEGHSKHHSDGYAEHHHHNSHTDLHEKVSDHKEKMDDHETYGHDGKLG